MDELMKSYMAIMADRDAAIRERNMALAEKKKALTDRDIAMLQRDAAVSERNSILLERDEVITQFQYRKSSITENSSNNKLTLHRGSSMSENGIVSHMSFMPYMAEAAYNPREVPFSDTFPDQEPDSESVKPKKPKKGTKKKSSPSKKTSKTPTKKVNKRGKKVKNPYDGDDDSEEESQWKKSKSRLDKNSMPGPVCSCTGNLQPCYKWGNGGWQSACCTTTISMFPLPQLSNKRRSRMGGRKMSGSVYAKLVSRLAGEGHDFSSPIDLKNHWAKHGTNRYITIK